ncbi:pyridoxamine 5'-phosphate oxidase family protein [Streptomyces sp. NPDC057702]|uniref:pyridoxamine 5'-phosphate oxidase family protein n=1 Tax=unclassified Streptomyces TaxID=2593676 RepID=UPI0036CFF296
MPLSVAERQSFLAEPHVAALAVAEVDRAPLNVPVWYAYEPGGDVRVMTERGSRKARLITTAGRFSLLVQRTEPTYRYVTVEGPVVAVEPATEEELSAITARYLPPERVAEYVARMLAHASDLVTFRLRTERWRSADPGT